MAILPIIMPGEETQVRVEPLHTAHVAGEYPKENIGIYVECHDKSSLRDASLRRSDVFWPWEQTYPPGMEAW